MPYNIKTVIINTAYKDTQYTGMNQVSFQCRPFSSGNTNHRFPHNEIAWLS